MKRAVTIYTDVEVEVDLRRFSVDLLLEELRERIEDEGVSKAAELTARRAAIGHDEDRCFYIPLLNKGEHHPLESIYYALKFGKQEHALDLLRDFLGDIYGVVL